MSVPGVDDGCVKPRSEPDLNLDRRPDVVIRSSEFDRSADPGPVFGDGLVLTIIGARSDQEERHTRLFDTVVDVDCVYGFERIESRQPSSAEQVKGKAVALRSCAVIWV
jgi:hypothetical protein